MPRSFVSGSSQYLNKLTALVTAAPLTMHAWVYPQFTSGVNTVCCMGNVTLDAFYLYLFNGNVSANTSQTTGANGSVAIPPPIRNRWLAVGGVWASSTSRQAFCDGGGGVIDTTSKVPVAPTETLIGARKTGVSRDGFFTGLIAEIAVWNVSLSSAEMAALRTGLDPSTVRGGSLVDYWRLDASTDDQTGYKGNVMTNVGSTRYGGPRAPRGNVSMLGLPSGVMARCNFLVGAAA